MHGRPDRDRLVRVRRAGTAVAGPAAGCARRGTTVRRRFGWGPADAGGGPCAGRRRRRLGPGRGRRHPDAAPDTVPGSGSRAGDDADRSAGGAGGRRAGAAGAAAGPPRGDRRGCRGSPGAQRPGGQGRAAAGDAGLLAEVLSARLYVLWAPETAVERLATSTEIIELAVRTGDVRRELDGRMWRLIALLEFGRVAEAEAELDHYERLAERLGQPEFLFFARSRRATLATLRGRFDEAERLARAAYDLAVKAGLPDAVNVFGSQLAAVATGRGRNPSDEIPEHLAVQDLPLVLQAYGLLAAGRRDEARALLPTGLSAIDSGRVPGPTRWLYLAAVAEVAYQLGDADAARWVRDRLIRHADRFIVAAGAVRCGGAVSGLLGLCALTLDQLDDAVGWLRQAVASNRRIGAAPFLARAQAELAAALRRRGRTGDTQEARRLLAEAAKDAAELGMPVLNHEIARLDADDGKAVPDRPRLRRDGEDWLLTVG